MKEKLANIGASGVIAVVAVYVLLLFRGGFTHLPATFVGLVLCATGVVSAVKAAKVGRRLSSASLSLVALAVLFWLSALVNGLTLTTVTAAGLASVAAGFALLVGSKPASWRNQVLSFLTLLNVVVAALAIVSWLVGFAPFVDAGRLQFTFQYANAAGLWFALSALMCLLSPSLRLRAAGVVPLIALLLTQSFGAFLALAAVLVVGALVLMVRRTRGAADQEAKEPGALSGPLLSIGVVVVILVALAGVIGLTGRFPEAFSHLVERLIQIRDGFSLLAVSPLVGIGPDNWQYDFSLVQTAQYYVTVIHSSFMIILLDSGVLGFAAAAAAVVFGVRQLVGEGNSGLLACLGLCLLHFLIDFDIRFMAITLLAVLLLCAGDEAADSNQTAHKAALPIALAASVVCIITLVGGLLASSTEAALQDSLDRGDARAVQEHIMQNPLVAGDVGVRSEFCALLADHSDYPALVALYDQAGAHSDVQAALMAQALFETGRSREATVLLLDFMEVQPGNYRIFEAANTLFEQYGLDPVLAFRYQDLCGRTNKLLQQGLAPLLTNQHNVGALMEQ